MTSQKNAELGSATSSVKPIDSHARFIVVGVIVVGSFIALLNQTVMSPALPALMRDFNITTGTVQWVTSVYMLVSGIMVPISGYLIDKFSTRKLFAGALATFMVGTLLCAVAPNFVLLLVGRILQSAGSGVLLPLVAVVPMLVYPPDKRGTAMGMAGIVMAAGPAIGPVVGGLVIDGFGWRPMFIGIAVVTLVILVGGTMMLKNVGELKNPKLNVLSVILSTIAFGGLLYGFSSASTMGWASPVVITSIVVGLVAFVAFVYKQVKLDEPLLRVDTLATRNFRNSAILVTLINAAVAATNVTLPIFIQNVLGQSATVTGMVMLPAAAVGIILSPVAGAAFDKFGPRGVGIGGLALMTISLGLLGTINTRTSVLFVAVFCALQASGQAIANMPINTWGVNALPNDMIAHGNAIANTGRQIAAAIATSLLVTAETSVTASHMSQGVKSATASGIAFSYLLCAAISLVALIICIFTVTSRAKEKAARNAKAYEAQASAEVAAETTEGQPAEHHYAGAYVAPAASLFKQAQEQSIGGIMDDQPYSCLDSDDITHVVREFIRLNVSSLPVVNGDGRLVGFVSDGDVMKSIATYESRTVPTGTGSTMVVFDDETVASKVQALSGKHYGKIYLMLGINELGTGTAESWAAQYKVLLDEVRELQPDAIIFLQAIFHTTQEKSDATFFKNSTIDARNAELQKLADNETVFYIDCNPVFDDSTGALTPEYSGDGVHVKAAYYPMWRDYLFQFGVVK